MNETPEPQSFSVAPTRVWINGEAHTVTPGEMQSYVPPSPQESPMRVRINDEVVEPGAAPEPEPDPRMERLADEAAYIDAYWTMDRHYHTPEEYRLAARATQAFMANQQRRKETGRVFLEDFEYQPIPRPPWLKEEEE